MLCIFIDALNPNYLKFMPFLSSMKKVCLHGGLEVPLGYTGNIASFMTGMWPDKHGIFDLFIPDDKPKKKTSKKYYLGFKRLVQGKRLFYTPPKTKAMYYFKTALDKNWAQRNCLKLPTIFDVLEKEGRSFESIDWPNHYKDRKVRTFFSQSYKTVLKKVKKAKSDFIFVHFLDLETAHDYGVDSIKVIETAKNIDEAVKQLWDKHEEILIFSDHGMDNIEKEVDIIPEIKKLNLKFGKDFIYIIGSTTVEFWFRNKESKEKIVRMLKKLNYGKIIRNEDFKIRTNSLVFLADFKTAFNPNFFSSRKFRAMHGWSPKLQKTYYILKSGKKGIKNAKMVDFFPTIVKLMGLPEKKVDGRSLI